MRLRHAVLLSLLLVLSAASSLAGTIKPTGKARDREVIVKIRDSASANDIGNVERLADADRSKRLAKVRSGTLWHMHSRSKGAEAMAAALEHNPNVEYVEPNYEVHLVATPNDAWYTQLWGLNNTGQIAGGVAGAAGADIDAESAWNVTTGSASVVVGVIDTGIDYNHPDLQANIWSNPGGKGNAACSTGTHGFNAITGTCDPSDDHGHGTHVAGTIGAVGNNGLGVVGVNWTASIMGLKFLDAYGYGSTADAIEAIDFAVQAKIEGVNVRVLSNSWGGGPFSKALFDEINKASEHDVLFVAAAGNDSVNNDLYPHYPSSYPAANMISVAATDNRDGMAYFSNYGPTTVHLGAPGVSVLSTIRGSSYGTKSGTSMATPHVAGVAALVLAASPSLTTAQVKSAILGNTDSLPSLAGKTITGGRLNAAKAVGAPASPDFTVSVSPASRTVVRGSSASYTVTVTPTNGFAATINLSATGLPAGASATFTPSATTTSSLIVTTTAATPINSQSFVITGTSGAFSRSTTATLSVVSTPPPASSCPSLSLWTPYPAASTANAIAVGDFNRDARSDLVLAETALNRVSVRLGTGFSSGTTFSVGTAPLAVITADFNADGKPDIATANSGSNNVTILAGNGDGSFLPAAHYAAGTSPFALAAGDFDRDGALDLAVANNASADISVLRGQGDGTFAAPASYAAASGPFSVAVADVDGDGKLDLAVANFNADTISLLRGNGDGSFQAPLHTAVGDAPSAVAAGDLDGDGTIDLAVSNHNSSNVSRLSGNGDGTFDPAVHFAVGSGPYSVALGDINGDGRADLITANAEGLNLSVLLSNGNGTFQAATHHAASSPPAQSVVSDLDGDGKADIATAHEGGSGLSILRNVGTCSSNCGTIASAVHYGVGTTPESIATGDFNGDGKTDLATVNRGSNNVSISLGTGTGTFIAGVTVPAGTSPHGVVAGDFDRDGKLDLAIASSGSNEVAILLGNGDGTFQTAVNYPAGTTPRSVAAGDFNRDGKLDLAVVARGADTVAILRGSDGGAFQAPVSYAAGDGPESVAVGDFDRDGILDVAAANSLSGNVSILRGKADGTFLTATSVTVGTTPYSLVVADLDGDGKPDLAVANAGSNTVSVLLGIGNGTFQPAADHAVAQTPTAVTAGDFNDDGRLDLATANKSTAKVSLLFSTGAGSFAAAVNSTAGTAPAGIAAGDFNRDGKPDLASANSGSATISILLVTCPVPDLAVAKTHTGTFTQGATGRTYTITVTNVGGTATNAPVTVADQMPAGLTATAISGTGWTCTLSSASCARVDALAAGASYPAITLTVRVASSAPATVTNTATVSGGGELNGINNGASDPTTIVPATDVTMTKTHTGSFSQGAVGRFYTLVVRNAGGAPTSGAIAVTDTLPSGLTATALAGTGWSCNLGALTCTRSDVLGGGAQYPAIRLTVSVAANAASSLVNVATVAGGGDTSPGNNTASDPTVIWSSQTCAAFAAPTPYPIGSGWGYVASVVAGDFNEDGKQDFAGTNQYSGQVTVYAGLGDGGFGPATHYTAANARRIAAADMDRDGDLDLVVAGGSSPAMLFILLGQGDGTFADPVSFPGPTSFFSGLAVADFNSDGNPDVATTGYYTAKVYVHFGNGDGTVQPGVPFDTPATAGFIAISDFDGNGTADLAVSISYGLAILLGNGNGTFRDAVSISLYDTPSSIAVGDFNGDRHPDLAIADYYHAASVRLGRGDGTFQDPIAGGSSYGTSFVTAEDISGDGKLDLILTNASADSVGVAIGNGDGTFQSASQQPAGYDPVHLAVSDFNGDGRADLAVARFYDSTVGILLGGCPDVTIAKTHTGNFRAGQTDATYSLQVTTSGASTRGVVTVKDFLPAGLTATDMYGSDWSCVLSTLTCTRSVSVSPGQPSTITLTVSVSSAAPTSVTNTATVAGGADVNTSNNTATDPTTIVYAPDLTVRKTHNGAFTSGQNGVYTITVGNIGPGPTTGDVTVVDQLPNGMTAVGMTGPGWNCSTAAATCTRSDALGATSTYPPITLTVSVGVVYATSVTNIATVSGGGEGVTTSNNTASDNTQIIIAPENLTATAVSTTQVSVSWSPVSAATTYDVLRSSNNGPYTLVGSTISTNFIDSGRSPNTTYVYKVRGARDGVAGPLSEPELATTILFTDPTVTPALRVKAAHIVELRNAVNAVRAAAGLPPTSFTDPTLPGARIKAVHLTQLRDGLAAARTLLGVSALPGLALGSGSTISSYSLTALRAGVR